MHHCMKGSYPEGSSTPVFAYSWLWQKMGAGTNSEAATHEMKTTVTDTISPPCTVALTAQPRTPTNLQVPVSALGSASLTATKHARWVAEEVPPDPWITTSKAAAHAAALAAEAGTCCARRGQGPRP
jgi:hypothetical protein